MKPAHLAALVSAAVPPGEVVQHFISATLDSGSTPSTDVGGGGLLLSALELATAGADRHKPAESTKHTRKGADLNRRVVVATSQRIALYSVLGWRRSKQRLHHLADMDRSTPILEDDRPRRPLLLRVAGEVLTADRRYLDVVRAIDGGGTSPAG